MEDIGFDAARRAADEGGEEAEYIDYQTEIRKPRSGSLKEAIVQYLHDPVEESGVIFGTCSLCLELVSGNTTRLAAHLLGTSGRGIFPCPKTRVKVQQHIQSLQRKVTPLPTASNPSSKQNTSSAFTASGTVIKSGQASTCRTAQRNGDIRSTMPVVSKVDLDGVDSVVADYFYGMGVPFDHANNPLFVAMCKAISSLPPGTEYAPPSSYRLRTTMLRDKRAEVEKSLKVCVLASI